MRRLLSALSLGLAVLLAPPVLAQGGLSQPQSPILVIESERLFIETEFGQASLRAIDEQARRLASESREIDAQLIEEERALTEARPTLSAEEFRARADAFDDRVLRLRRERDEASTQLGRARDEAEQILRNAALPVLAQIVLDRGAVAVFERRDVFIVDDAIDITDEAVARINEQLGADDVQTGTSDSPTPPAETPEQSDTESDP
ncbi:OmpH family outer membrane protein [Cognatishimia sp. MH4019]|uniref:OmpH family outer membrane protein n=1 Tax=Cognatishimia sp. MH4019 TaxID=2854030 RepID=UPI001CD64968|nr:OmpH family outer membrane protein [Cognatishimia sp. MH4019]